MTESFIRIAGVVLTFALYVGGFFPAYYFAKRRLRRNRLVSILAGIHGLFLWGVLVFMVVEFSIPLWRSYSALTIIGGALMTLAPYLFTYRIVTSNPPKR
jgi:hypothetical protein